MITNFSFANGYWLAERALITVTEATPNGNVRLRVQTKLTLPAPWRTRLDVTYITDENGNLVIDVSDALRTYRTAHSMRVIVEDIADEEDAYLGVQIMGLVSPLKLLTPESPNLSAQYGQYIMPPQRMLQAVSADVSAMNTHAECYFAQPSQFTIPNAEARFVDETKRAIQCYNKLQIRRNGTIIAEYQLELASKQCRLYAVVEWVSMTGILRRHTFWVIKPEIEVADKYDLLTNDNSYKEIKGHEDGCTLMIDGLNAYDVWYYSDLAMSSEVRVALYNGAGLGLGFMPALITTKKVTMPDGDGGKLGSVEFECKYKRYDAVAM